MMEGPGAESEEKREPASDIETAAVDSLECLTQIGRLEKADLLTRWAFNQMLIGVATRKYARSVRLPDGDLAGEAKRATTKSSVSRRFVALSTAKLKKWLAADLSELDLLVIQIDGLHVGDHVLVAAIGIDGAGDKHVLAVALGATENAAVVKALLADLVERGLQPDIARLFIRRQGTQPGGARYFRWFRANPTLPSS